MSELQATRTSPSETGPQIGDVLASIRRLIAEDGDGPDFAGPARRTDNSGLARSTLPLGPRTEKIRSVIERELGAIDLSGDRLVLHDGARVTADAETAPAVDAAPPPASEPPISEDVTRQGSGCRPEPIAKDIDMMLAETSRIAPGDEAVRAPMDAAFDLFAADADEDDDQLAGGNALRDLVRDVIRQELQGDIGERISRNLRRAIRQEVAAAITAGLRPA